MKEQTVITMSEYTEHEFDNRLQGYIDILNENNRQYTIQFSTAYNERYSTDGTKFSAMIIFEGDCCL